MDKYEKLYNEALEKARMYRDNAKAVEEYAAVARYENIFPQLCESEDERIRKEMVDWLKSFLGESTPVGYTEHEIRQRIAWLEKQKEPVVEGRGLYYYDGEKFTYCGYPATEDNPYDFAMSQQEKQKENPKSTDSIQSDVKCENRWHKVKDSLPDTAREVLCKDDIGNFFIGRYYKKSQGWMVMMYDDCDKSNEDNPPVIMWCDIPSEEQKEQKPAEKQDYSGLNDLERAIHRGFLAAGLEDVPVTIIKETAKECVAQMKPAEWDDYTKTNLDRALQIIKDAKGKLQGYQSDDGIYECDKAIEALEHFLYRGLEIEKPVEWSEEDNIGWDEAFACVTRAEKAAKNEEELQNAVTAEKWLKEIKFKYCVHPVKQEQFDDCLNRTYQEGFNDGLKYRMPMGLNKKNEKMIHWLIGIVNANVDLSLKDKTELTRWLEALDMKREFSQKDKRIIDAIMIGYQDKNFCSSQIPTTIGVSKEEVVDWLKSLRPQPKQEWDTHDKAIVNCIVCCLDGQFVPESARKQSLEWFNKHRRDFLNSPHWKPSEEQMEALETAKRWYSNLALESLFEQLKKLM